MNDSITSISPTDFAPAWWTMADLTGNEVDVSTVAQRDG
jgi:hypothetical protein